MANYRPPSRERTVELVKGLTAFMEKAGEVLAAQEAAHEEREAAIEGARFPRLARLRSTLSGDRLTDPWDEVRPLSAFGLGQREGTGYREVIEAANAACATLSVLSDTQDPVEGFEDFHEIEEFRNSVISAANELGVMVV